MAFTYKKTGSCLRASGAQTDYPMYLVVGESAGSPAIMPSPSKVLNYPPEHSTTYVKATTAQYPADDATDPSKSLTGSSSGTSWLTTNRSVTNQRFHIDLGSAKKILGIYYENYHSNGANTNAGAKNFIMQGSAESSAFAELTYATDTNWTQIGGSMQFEQHVASNVADPKYIGIANNTAYRYYALKIADNWGNAYCIGLRRIVLLTDDGFVHCSGHCQSDFGDIRFYDGSGNALDYMIDWPSLTGTTPNQSVGVWVKTNPGTSATDVVLKYGDSGLSDGSNGANVFDLYEDAEWGSDDDPVTDSGGSVTWIDRTYNGVISTDAAHSGTRSIALDYDETNPTSVRPTITMDEGKALQFWLKRYTNQSYIEFFNGAGDASYGLMLVFYDNDLSVKYKTSSTPTDTGLDIVSGAWNFFEIKDINYTAHTATLCVNDSSVTVSMRSGTNVGGDVWFYGGKTGGASGYFTYIDNLIVRKYASPEPVWGTWGEETEIVSSFSVAAVTGTLNPSASASPGISATSTTATLSPSASAGVQLSVAAQAAILGPVLDANIGLSIAAVTATLGPSASADLNITDPGVLIICQSATLSPSASASPGISATSTTATLNPSASAGVQLSVAAQAAILGPVLDANIGLSIAAVTATLGPSASADFDINSEASVLVICQPGTLSPSVSAGVQISVASQTATLSPSAAIPNLYLILPAETAVLNPSASAAPAIGITATPAILDPTAGIPGLTLSLSVASAVLDPSASAGAMEVFRYENPVILYYFTLTGAADDEDDATIPISSFQARHRSGESTYLSVVIPDYTTYEDIIDARSNGQMVIRMAFSNAGAVYHSEEILRVDLDTNGIRKDQGGNSQSITLVGHRTETYSPQTLTLKNVTYRRTGNAGEISYRCATPDIFLRPGDTALYGSDSFTVGLITYSVSSGYTAMEVTEALS